MAEHDPFACLRCFTEGLRIGHVRDSFPGKMIVRDSLLLLKKITSIIS